MKPCLIFLYEDPVVLKFLQHLLIIGRHLFNAVCHIQEIPQAPCGQKGGQIAVLLLLIQAAHNGRHAGILPFFLRLRLLQRSLRIGNLLLLDMYLLFQLLQV